MPLPSELAYGYALGYWIESWGDSPADPDRLPDARPSSGTLKIVPVSTFITAEDGKRTATGITPRPITCTLGPSGELLDEAGALGVFLVTGMYRVTLNIVGSPVENYDIVVTEEHTEQQPLDLVRARELTPTPPVKFILTEQTLKDAEDAADRAEAAAKRAESIGGGTSGVNTVNQRRGDVTLTKADVGLPLADNTADADKPISTLQGQAFGLRALASRRILSGTGLSGGGDLTSDVTFSLTAAVRASLALADTSVQPTALASALTAKADLVNGLLPTSQLPPLAISDVFPVASQAAMLALTAQRGDIAVRSDTNSTYILGADAPGTLANWKLLSVPTSAGVTSINGQTGAVVLGYADVGAAAASHTHTVAQITDAAASFAPIGRGINTDGTYLTGGGTLGADRTIALTTAAKASLAKADSASQPGHTHTASAISDASTVGKSVLTAASALAARTALGITNTSTSRPATAVTGTALTFDASQANTQTFTMTGATTVTMVGTPDTALGFTSYIVLKQDATGGRPVAWPTSILWGGGALPVLSTAAGAVELIQLEWTGVDWLGMRVSPAFSKVAAAVTQPDVITTSDTFAGNSGAAPKAMWSRSASYPTTGGTVTLNGSGGMVLAPAATTAWNDGGAASVFLGDPTHPEGVSSTGAPAIAPDYDYTFRYKLLNLLEQYQSIVLRGRNADLWTGGGGWNTFQVGTFMRLAPAGKAVEIITGYNTGTIDTLSGFTFPSNDMYIRIMVKKSRLAFKIWAASLGKSGEPGGVGSDTNWTYTNTTIMGNQSDGNIGFAAVNGPAVERKTVTISEFAATTQVLTLGTDRATFPADPAGFTRILTEDFNTDAVAGTGTGQFQKVYVNSFQPYSDGGTVFNPADPTNTGGANATSRMISAHDGVMDVYSDGVYASGGSFGSPTNTYNRQGGRFSIRMKAHGMFGNGPAFMMWPSDTAKGTWYFGELDFPESVSGRGGFAGFQDSPWIHHHKMVQGSEDQATSVPLNVSWRDWHVYTMEWFPPGKGTTPATGNVRYLVDGIEIANITNDVPSTVHRWCFQIGDWGTPGHIYIDGYAMSALTS